MTDLPVETADVTDIEIIDVMSETEARSLTDELRGAAARSWAIVADIDSRRGFKALGYDSLTAWGKAELGYSASYVSRLASQGEVVGIIQALPIGNPETLTIPNEAQARELAPLKDDPQALAAIWARTTATEDKPTANAVRALVNNVRPDLANRKPVGRPRKDITSDPQTVAAQAAAIADPVIRAAMEDAAEPVKGVVRSFVDGAPSPAVTAAALIIGDDINEFSEAVNHFRDMATLIVELWEHGSASDRVDAAAAAASVMALTRVDVHSAANETYRAGQNTSPLRRTNVEPIVKTGRKK